MFSIIQDIKLYIIVVKNLLYKMHYVFNNNIFNKMHYIFNNSNKYQCLNNIKSHNTQYIFGICVECSLKRFR